jgi:CDI immunity proteins
MDLNATLDELEATGWCGPQVDSPMVERIHFLGRVPLRELTTEDVRLILGQNRAVKSLLPLALDLLSADPFAEGDHYPGDLLLVVARVAPGDDRIKKLLATAIARLDELDEIDRDLLETRLREAYDLC